jgi:hypothetical protein
MVGSAVVTEKVTAVAAAMVLSIRRRILAAIFSTLATLIMDTGTRSISAAARRKAVRPFVAWTSFERKP